jgi:arabinogalactan endo-1,4-beta-galactosidase
MFKGWIHVAVKTVITGTLFLSTPAARAQDHRPIVGADISMLPEIERAGGVYRQNGKPQDAIQILRDHDCTLFRLRLFVNPETDFNKSYGATQDLPYVRALAKRIKSAGGQLLLDLHYSDTWADPGKQFKPAAWSKLDFDALEKQVHDYTVSVLKDLHDNDISPDMVQVGNEITSGILWPDGKVLDAPKDQEQVQWQRFSRLLNAGTKAVRETDPTARIILHIHGGGKPGLPKWFFAKLDQYPVDFDIVGLSFYPAWGDSLDALKQNMKDVVGAYGKDVLIVETSYPWRDLETTDPAMQWPQTPAGQRQFLHDLVNALDNVPKRHGLGFVWWYPEAIPTHGLQIWRQGHEAIFDDKGSLLPTFDALSPKGH